MEDIGQKSLCQIQLDKDKKISGFLGEIPSYYSLKLTKAIITNSDSIKELISVQEIKILIDNKKLTVNNKYIFTEQKYNIKIIELENENKDLNNLKNYFTMKHNIFENELNFLNKDKIIYILYLGENKKIFISYGQLQKENENEKEIFNFLSSRNDFPIGSPIFNFKNKKLLGFYKGYNNKKNIMKKFFLNIL